MHDLMEDVSSTAQQRGRGGVAKQVYGELHVLYTPHLNAWADVQEHGKLPLGVGTEEELVAWARRQQSNLTPFGYGTNVRGIWIEVLPTEGGRIPWEVVDAQSSEPARLLLLEGEVDFASLYEAEPDLVRITLLPS